MPPSTITTSGTQSPLVSSALSYPQNADPTTYLPYQSPQIILSSGTWRHPKPGFPISVRVTIIGGGGGGGGEFISDPNCSGGGGGAGRINDIMALTVTSDMTVVIGAGGTATSQTTGGTGGQSSFGTNTAAGGIGGGNSYLSASPTGGQGSVGGGGGRVGGAQSCNGGAGDTYIGGGGGYSASGGTQVKGASAIYPQTPQIIPTNGPAGVPNGGNTGIPGLGGLLSTWRPELLYYGDGGNGGYNATANMTVGKQGAIFIWYNRP